MTLCLTVYIIHQIFYVKLISFLSQSHRKNYNMARPSEADEPAPEPRQPPPCGHVHAGATEVHGNVSAKSQ